MTIQPKVPPPNGIEVVHVPADPLNGRKILFLPTIKVDGCDAPTGYTAEAEQKLKQVPNVRRYNETFDWKSRSLYEANINGTGVPDDYQGIYFVYKCTKARAGLQMNGGLEHMPRVRAYGDFFVFRLKNPGYSASGQADFGAFGAGFLKDYDNHGFAKCLLSSMAIVPNEEEKKKEEKEEKEKKKNMAKEKQESKEMEEKNEKGEKKEKKEKKEEEKKKQEKQEKKEKKENKQKKESSKK